MPKWNELVTFLTIELEITKMVLNKNVGALKKYLNAELPNIEARH